MKLETFFKNFELLADAPNGVQKLRELILQLAVQGKLVPQEPTDEPASVLLEKVKIEKERLINEGRIRKTEPLPLIKVDEIPFELPKGWEWVRLDFICNQVTDGTHHTPTYTVTGVPFLSVKDISSGKINLTNTRYISQEEHEQLIKRCNPEFEDVLLTKVGTTGIAKVIDVNAEFSVFVSLALLKFSKHLLSPYYIELVINSPLVKEQSKKNTQGIGNKNLVLKYIKNFTLPMAPVQEQKRIVAKVNQLMALCDELETRQRHRREGCVRLNNAAIAQLLTTHEPNDLSKHWQSICNNFDLLYSVPENIGKLRQAIIQLAVQGKLVPQDLNDEPASIVLEKIKLEKEWLVKEKKIGRTEPLPPIEVDEVPHELPEGWKWTRFGAIILDIDSGWSPMCEKRPKEVGEWGVLKVSAVSWDKFNPYENKVLPIGLEPRPEHETKVGDFLMSRANTSHLVGKSVIVENTPERLLLSDKLLRVTFSDLTDKLFFNLYNNSLTAREYYSKKASGTSTSMRNISRGQILNMPIPIPPLTEQKRIVAKVEQLMKLCDELEAKLTQSQTDSEKLMDAAVRQVLGV